MTDSQKLIERLRDKSEYAFPDDLCREAADALEDLQKKLAACRAARDRLARQVDGYKQAGKTTLDKFVGRKKT